MTEDGFSYICRIGRALLSYLDDSGQGKERRGEIRTCIIPIGELLSAQNFKQPAQGTLLLLGIPFMLMHGSKDRKNGEKGPVEMEVGV